MIPDRFARALPPLAAAACLALWAGCDGEPRSPTAPGPDTTRSVGLTDTAEADGSTAAASQDTAATDTTEADSADADTVSAPDTSSTSEVAAASSAASCPATSPSTGDYRSAVSTGDWSTASTWETWDGSSWTTASSFPGSSNTNQVTICDGDQVNVTSDGTFGGPITVQSGAVLSVGTVTATYTGRVELRSGPGTLLIADQGTFVHEGGTFLNDGDVHVPGTGTDGFLRFGGTSQTLSGSGTWNERLTVTVGGSSTTTLGSDVRATLASLLVNGTLGTATHTLRLVDASTTISSGARLEGSGRLHIDGGSFDNRGTVAPGTSVGDLSIEDDYDHGSGTLEVEIVGTGGPGTGHDHLDVTGSVSLSDGTLDILLPGSFTPSPGDSFTLLDCSASCSGTFGTVNVPSDLPPHDIEYGSNDVVLRMEGNQAPEADAGGPYSAVAGSSVSFDGTGSKDPDGDALTYEWDFGDGATATGATPTHTYSDNGTFTVTLTVTDPDGASDTDQTTADIANQPPTASISAPSDGSLFQKGETITFEGSGDDFEDGTLTGNALSWSSDEDGALGNGGTLSISTLTAGVTHTITLTVTDGDGGTDQATIEVRVNAPPTADADGSYSADEGSAVSLDGTGSTDPEGGTLSYEWDLGDGTTATGATPTHTYADNGTFTVTLTVTDPDGGTASDQTTAEIDNVAPTVDAGPDRSVTSGDVLDLSATFEDPGVEDDPWSFTVDWGDGDSSTGSTSDQSSPIEVSHRYCSVATVDAEMSVTDKDGGTGSDAVQVDVSAGSASIDIKPGSQQNPVRIPGENGRGEGRGPGSGNGNPGGVLPVAVLTTPDLDATGLDPSTIRLGNGAPPDTPVAERGNGTLMATEEDVDDDGDLDLLLQFNKQELVDNGDLTQATTEFILTAEDRDGCRVVQGSDRVRIVPSGPK